MHTISKAMLSGLVCFFYFLDLPGQSAAMFEATIWFEDAVGNRDSIIVGYDTLATEDIDPIFGEEEIITPFDSIFDVRAGSIDYFYRKKLSKKLIGVTTKITFGSDSGCFIASSKFIYIWAQNQPVKIWWSRPLFNNTHCNRGSLISNHWMDEVAVPYDWDGSPQQAYWCMAVTDSLVIDLSEPVYEGIPVWVPVEIEKEVEGMGLQTIYGMRFVSWSPNYSPCAGLLSGDSGPVKSIEDLPFLGPNPAGEKIWLHPEKLQGISSITLYDYHGKPLLAYRRTIPEFLDISMLPSGAYLVIAVGKDGMIYHQKLVKI